jgi:hypothetical protein
MRRRRGRNEKEGAREVEDHRDVWALHVSGSMRRASLSNVDIGPTCQGFLYVKS